MRTGLTPEEELQVRQLRFDRLVERSYRVQAAEAGRLRLRGVFAVGYLIIAAFNLEQIATHREPATWQALMLGLGLPLLPLLASCSRVLTRFVMSLTAFGWFVVVCAILATLSPKSTLQDFTERALIQVVVASCAVVLVRMPAYLVAFCGYALFAAYCWVLRSADFDHPGDPAFRVTLVRIAFQLFGSVTIFVVGAYFTETMERRSYLTRQLLAEERLRTQKLIANMLPPAITERLLEHPDVIAEMHPDVTVMFADIVGFTPYAASHTAQEVVGRLNSIFSRFDEIVERERVEKIKTIGDAYMVAAGLPEFRPDHLETILGIGLEMLQVAHEMGMDLRIGVQSGGVMAGVIGTKKYLYDLWGTTVNTASRMESHGVPGKIQVTEAVVRRAESRFAFEPRGVIEVKGLGKVQTYFSVGRIADALPEPSSESTGSGSPP